MGHDLQDATTTYTAVVLAGGRATRFGADKLAVAIEGVPLFDRVIAAVSDATEIIAVGDASARSAQTAITWTREQPPGSGPANAIVAALPLVRTRHVVVLAADLPYTSARTTRRLLAAARPAAALVDAEGRPQYLCAAFETDALRSAAGTADWTNHSVRELLAPLELQLVPAEGDEARDVDTPEDVPSDT